MDDDALLSLALAVHANPGAYVLLLGSGVSRAARIPTGWEVVLDLIGQVVAARGAPPPADPVAWYRETFGEEPDYARLLDRLAATPAERMTILRGYFEPSEEEREQGLKRPTRAHRAIAALARDGFVRLILTTNFDRLLERALEEAGVVPDVVSTDDAVRGMLPYIHSRCTVVKLHGDYRDPRIRNTPAELAAYAPELDALLDRVLDEFGLVVCGWSAEYDTALAAAITRCPTRRFATFWLQHGRLGDAAARLARHRRAQVVPIASADAAFEQLREAVESLRELRRGDPRAVGVAVAAAKRYVADPQQRIRLHDLVGGALRQARAPADALNLEQPRPDERTIPERLRHYEAATERLAAVLGALAYHGEPAHQGHVRRAIDALLRIRRHGGFTTWVELQRYPALLAGYAAGVSAAAAGNYAGLAALFAPTYEHPNREEPLPAVALLNAYSPILQDIRAALPIENAARRTTPVSDYLFEATKPVVSDYFLDEQAYDDAFDLFEYLTSLLYLDANPYNTDDRWAPIGRIIHRYGGPAAALLRSRSPMAAWLATVEAEGQGHGIFRTGLFGGLPGRLQAAARAEAALRARGPSAIR